MSRPESLTRRHALRGAAAVGIGIPVLAACGGSEDAADDAASTPTPSDTQTSAAPEETPEPSSEAPAEEAPAADALTTTGDVPEGSGTIFESEGVVVTQPTAGEFKCFENICTHQGCPVTGVTDVIECACHNSHFSLADGSVVAGPATAPLPEVSITVDGDSISLA